MDDEIPETVICDNCGVIVSVANSWHAFPPGHAEHLCNACYQRITRESSDNAREAAALARYEDDRRRKEQKRKQGRGR